MPKELPKRGLNSRPTNERDTVPEAPRLSLQDGTLPGPATLAVARVSRPSAPAAWPPAEVTPARDVLLCAIGALLLGLLYVYW